MAPPYPSRKAAASRKLLKDLPSEEEIAHIASNLQGYEDAAMALLGCSCIQNALLAFIKTKLVPLSKEDDQRLFDGNQNGIISTFSSQLRIAFAMGLIDRPVFDDLMLMYDIRNVFAHSIHPISFSHLYIEYDCGRLALSEVTKEMGDAAIAAGGEILMPHAKATYHNSIVMHFHSMIFAAKGIPARTPDELTRAFTMVARKKYTAPKSA